MRRRIKCFTVFFPILCLFALTINVTLLNSNGQSKFNIKLIGEPRALKLSLDAIWQNVPNTRYKVCRDFLTPILIFQHSSNNIYVYSAFLEERVLERQHLLSPPVIRLIGVSKFKKQFFRDHKGVNLEIVCRFWYDEKETSNTAE
jgi:hypothetical protein